MSEAEFALSQEQLDAFDNDGYIILPSISDEITRNIIEWSAEIKKLPHLPNAWMHYDEIDGNGRTILSRTERFADYHSGFDTLFRAPRLLAALKDLSGEEMALLKEKVNYRGPGSGGFKAHTDMADYLATVQGNHLTIMLAVEPATLENGCLEIVPGSHKIDIPTNDDMCLTSEWVEQHEWVPVPLRTGECLIFGSRLAHRSGANNSPHGRASVYATYNALSIGDKREEYYAHRRIHWPATADRIPGKDYEYGARIYAAGTPMLTVDRVAYSRFGMPVA